MTVNDSKLESYIAGLTEDTTPDKANDLLMSYDASAAGMKKVKMTNIGGTGDVSGPASATNGNLAVFDGTGGKTLKDGGTPTPAAAGYIITAANAALTAAIIHPELMDLNASGATNVDMSSASTGTGVSASLSNGLYAVSWTQNSYQYWDVASAVGTGNFDYRMRVTSVAATNAKDGNSTATALFCLYVADSSRTDSTSLKMMLVRPTIGSTGSANLQGVINGSTQGNPVTDPCMPVILRITRSGTTVSFYYSPDEGRTWSLTGTASSSLNIAKVGAITFMNNAGGPITANVHWVRSY